MMKRRIVGWIRWRLIGRHQPIPSRDILEVRVETLRRRQPVERRVIEAERPVQESARPAGVNHEPRRDADGSAIPRPLENRPGALVTDALEARLVEIDGSFGFGFARERLIEVRPVPMRVGDLVPRAGCHEELASVLAVVGKRLTRTMEEEGEPALQASRDIRPRALPGSPFRERANSRQSHIGQPALRAAGWPEEWTTRR